MPYVFNPFSGTFDWTAAGVPALTTGGVTFGSTTGTLSQDATNFNWGANSRQLSLSSSSVERITNGSFTGSASGWTVPTGWAYSNNSVSHSTNGAGALSQTPTLNLGERFELSFTLSNVTSGGVVVSFAGNVLGNYNTNGSFTYRGEVLDVSAGLLFAPSAITARLTIDNVSVRVLSGGRLLAGDVTVQGSSTGGVLTVSAVGKANGTPGTTRHASFDNTGGNTWIDFRFSGVNKAHIGANSSGEISTWISGGNGQSVYHQPTNTLISYNVASAFSHYGNGLFGGSVHAGLTLTPTSTLQSAGGTALKVRYVTGNVTLDNTATKWIVEPSSATCTGSPTTSCWSYNNEVDCLARDAHGGCSWFAGYSCAAYNGDQTNCEGTSGCTWEQASCSSFSDQTSCESYSGCSWTNNPQDCSTLDETSCGSTSGCTQNYDYCSNYSDGGGDGSACNNANYPGFCSYDSGTGTCDGGSWYTGCSGSYDSYSCTGSYATGNCTGTYGAACSGSASCGGIDDSTSCNGEAGCTWQTAVTLTLPNLTTCPDRDYWVYNASSSNADVVIVPHAGQQIDHTTSYTLSTFKDWVHISPFYRTASCGGFNEGTCNSTAGCSAYYANCSWNSVDYVCEGDASCSAYGNEYDCVAATYYSSCSGTYVVSQNWYVFGK